VGQRAIENHFAVPSLSPVESVGPHVSNYHIGDGKLKQAFDPNGIGENTGYSYVGADTAGHKLPTGYPEGRQMWIHLKAECWSGQIMTDRG